MRPVRDDAPAGAQLQAHRKLLVPLRSAAGSRINSRAGKALKSSSQHSKAPPPPADQAPSLPTASLSISDLSVQHRDVVRLLFRKFSQGVRFASSVQMNRGKCEAFLTQYGLMPHAKHLDEAIGLLLEDIHNAESYYNAHPSPARTGDKQPRSESPARARSTIFSTCAPCALPGFLDALQWLALANHSTSRAGARGQATSAAPDGAALLAQLLEAEVRPRLEKEIEPRIFTALRDARRALEEDAVLRLLLHVNKSQLTKLFHGYQLVGPSTIGASKAPSEWPALPPAVRSRTCACVYPLTAALLQWGQASARVPSLRRSYRPSSRGWA
eukprot:COSAG05_NODE_881_length_6789_cov_21.387743_13_plen_328_part_00